MKAITSAFSLAALFAALVVLPGCGGGDEAVPPPAADVGMPGESIPGDGMLLETPPGDTGAMEGAPAEPDDVDVLIVEPETP